jgi:hypothetical protein
VPPDTRHPARSPQIPAGPVDEVAESINASTVAPVATGTVWSLTTNGLSLKHQSDTLVANIRGRHARDVTILKPPRLELGWEPGPLSVELSGPWVVLRPDVSSRAR